MGTCATIVLSCLQSNEETELTLQWIPSRPPPTEQPEDRMLPSGEKAYFTKAQQDFYAQKLRFERPSDEVPGPVYQDSSTMLGSGSFGTVWKGTDLSTNRPIAMKQVSLLRLNNDPQKLQALVEEVHNLSQLQHKHIIKYLGSEIVGEFLHIYMEFASQGSISSIRKKTGSFSEAQIQQYTKQLLQGLEYLHAHNIMHRDIKGNNVLLDEHGTCKLADFGCSKQKADRSTNNAVSMRGTIRWMAPEVIEGTGHGRFADIWSVGCLIVEMATGQDPWAECATDFLVYRKVCRSNDCPDVSMLSVQAQDFVQQCLQRDPNQRPNVCDLLNHPFVLMESVTRDGSMCKVQHESRCHTDTTS